MGATTKVRLRFAKRGDLRLVSHHDLMRCLERTIRRAGLPMAYSQGFNPRPKVVFALAMALGIEGRREAVDLELAEPIGPDEVLRRLAACAPAGFDFQEAEALGPGRPARPEAARYHLSQPVPPDRRDAARAALASFVASERWPHLRNRPDRSFEVDLRPYLLGAELGPDGLLRFRLKVDPGGSARPEEILGALGLRDLLDAGAHLVRDEVELGGRGDETSRGPGPPETP